ncbi:phage portal protein [Nonomuraea rubra]
MSIWWRGRAQPTERAGWTTTTLQEVINRLKSRGFNEVDLSAAESSLQSVAVFAACDLIASIGSELPVDVYRGKGSERRPLNTPSWLEDPDGSGHGLADWCYRVLMSWLLRGNLYGEALQRSSTGFLQQAELFHPDRVSGWLEDGRVKWTVQGHVVEGEREFLHRRVNPMPGVVLGLSPIQLHATTVGVSLTSSRFGLQWFQDGAHPSGMLTNSEIEMDPDKSRAAKDRFMAALFGTREPLVLGKGWQYQSIQVTPEESQFLETQGYTEAQCARIFGPGIAEILGYASGSLTYSNIVDRDISLLKYAVGKWLRRLERLLSEFLPRPQYVRLNRDALLETNTLQRYQAYQSALANQWRVVNEVRALEDLAPVPWGDKPAMAQQPSQESDDPAGDGQGEE